MRSPFDDPFFGGMMRRHNSMIDQMFGGDPFDDPFFGGSGRRQSGNRIENGGESRSQVAPLRRSRSMFDQFADMTGSMDTMMRQGGGGGSFSSSSFSYSSSNNGGEPVVLRQSKSMRMGPSGAIEQQESMSDSRTGVEKLAIRRQLGDQARTIVKQRDRMGNEESRDDTYNIGDGEESLFDQRWQQSQHSHSQGRSIGGPRSGGGVGRAPMPQSSRRRELTAPHGHSGARGSHATVRQSSPPHSRGGRSVTSSAYYDQPQSHASSQSRPLQYDYQSNRWR
eukprot:GFYU01005094.1.p1 GENE.GFYU01005094.1~~GFYU01005094.1.p1  ORF type:complete len:280 (-),score=41.46 GFYU01005094.1:197-1036(-)